MTDRKRAIALDVGDRYVGIAATDHIDAIAYRYATIDRKQSEPFSVILDIVKKESIQEIVIGVPYHVEDGSETQQTKKTLDFISQLKEHIGSGVSYVQVDETLTSSQAKQNLKELGASVHEEHAEAARLMLQEYLSL
jgi:putative transcription antitermination factor YqgF